MGIQGCEKECVRSPGAHEAYGFTCIGICTKSKYPFSKQAENILRIRTKKKVSQQKEKFCKKQEQERNEEYARKCTNNALRKFARNVQKLKFFIP